MKRTITEKFDADGKLTERVTIEDDEAKPAPTVVPYLVPTVYPADRWRQPWIVTSTATADVIYLNGRRTDDGPDPVAVGA